jgi:dipeptide/tripeptide permease
MTKEQIDSSVVFYVEKMQTGTLNVPPNTLPEVTQILDSTISSAMKQTFNILALILLLGFVTTIFLPSRIKNS